MVERSAIIRNQMGIHCRPSAVILKQIEQYNGEIRVTKVDGTSADVRNILSLLALGLNYGDHIRIQVSGPREASCCAEMVDLFETTFDFPPRAD